MSSGLPSTTGSSRPYRSISGNGGIVSSSGSGGPTPQSSFGGFLSSPSNHGSSSVDPPGAGGVSSSSSQYPMRMAAATMQQQSMTIDEMRYLHRRALQEAEAKRTELRLVLASRYRELVGSSDEVLRMKERAKELHDLIHALPNLLLKLQQVSQTKVEETKQEAEDLPGAAADAAAVAKRAGETSAFAKEAHRLQTIRRSKFSELTRSVHRALDRNQVHLATTTLIQLFCLFASNTNEYPLANALAKQASETLAPSVSQQQMDALDPMLRAQMRMIYFQVQTLPRKILESSRENLLQAASYDSSSNSSSSSFDPALGAERSAAALASLDLLSRPNLNNSNNTPAMDESDVADRATFLLETYFDSKAQLLGSLFNQLTVKAADQAEGILSKIVLILQHDVIVHPYEIFILRKFPTAGGAAGADTAARIMETLPFFDPTVVQARCSKFLASHLPLIRTKVKSVLVSIAGTTASALGQIRQSLYDKTDGNECQRALNENPFCTWDEAVMAMVDVRRVLTHSEMTTSQDRKFSLWSALFSHTFSSLVHSLLTTSFHSVHAKVVSTLRASLSQAPPLVHLLPHEAYRNTMRIATDLDEALLKVSDDAHELLVHAEERDESERRLRESLYVQTCEILGRLLCEVRRIVTEKGQQEENRDTTTMSDGTRELIVGRLCHFLKFRLTSLPTLLDEESSPAAVKAQSSASTVGMISYMDLESAFSLADDDTDGLITFAEAMDATESAFSGTQFHGSEMLRGTLLLSDNNNNNSRVSVSSFEGGKDYLDVTLSELMLLTARGLRHGTGHYSALGMVQKALDDIVTKCFRKWADAALQPSVRSLSQNVAEFWQTASTTTDAEWRAFHGGGGNDDASYSSPSFAQTPPDTGSSSVPGVSPPTVGFITHASFILNRTTTPADSLAPVPSREQAVALGISQTTVPSLTDTLRWTLLRRSSQWYCSCWNNALSSLPSEVVEKANGTAVIQFYVDITFAQFCFLERNRHGFGDTTSSSPNQQIQDLILQGQGLLNKKVSNRSTLLSLPSKVQEKHRHVDEVCDLFMTSLFGRRDTTRSSSAGSCEVEFGSGAASSGASQPFCFTPLTSSRRFALLPIQTDRTLADLQLKGVYRKEKEDQERHKESIGGSVMSSGLGFFSSMLKKK